MKQYLLFAILFATIPFCHQGYALGAGSGNPGVRTGDVVTDRDGNEYRTVFIGEQEWMTQNLRTAHYANGDIIPNVTESSDWAALTSGAWAHYNNDDYFETSYGKLYNWHAVSDPRGLCPADWRVPTHEDWNILERNLGMPEADLERTGVRGREERIGGKLKSTDSQHWHGPNEGANNESGFDGLPGGNRAESGGFDGIGSFGLWWTSTEAGAGMAWMRMLSHDSPHVDLLYADKRYGFSVRCLRGEIAPADRPDPVLAEISTGLVSDITATSAESGGQIESDGGASVAERGIVWSTTRQPTLEINTGMTLSGSGIEPYRAAITDLLPETTYYVRAFVATEAGIAYGEPESFTTPPDVAYGTAKDIDGNSYRTMQIGEQVWMAENLRTSRYRNGEDITYVMSNSEWQDLGETESGAWAFYNNNAGNEPYGLLYNWYAVNDFRGLCPTGWRVATDQDWQQLEQYLGMSRTEANTTGWRGQNASVGGKLKAEGTEFWRGPNVGATNESNFTALAGGYRFTSGSFSYLSFFGYWWTATEADANTAWRRLLFNNRESINRMNYDKRYGFSVRCVQN